MSDLANSPLAVLTFIAAPAVLTNASSLLALGTSNRFARNVDRARQLMSSMKTQDRTPDAMPFLLRQIDRAERRAQLLIRALSTFYFSLGCFAAGSLTSLLGAISANTEYHVLLRTLLITALVAGICGLAGLLVGCAMLIRETRLALASLREDTQFFREHYEAAEARGKN